MGVSESLGLFLASAVIGAASAVLGLGGGLFLVPLLILALGIDPREAAPVGLVCTIATSAAGSIAWDKSGMADPALVVLLALPATLGAVLGARVLSALLPATLVLVLFAAVVLYSVWRMLVKARALGRAEEAHEALPAVSPRRRALGIAACGGTGVVSGLLGIGGGPVNVPVMTEVLRLPLKRALASSNLLVGMTAAAGAAVYYAQGMLRVGLVGPCVLGISLGAYVGGRVGPRLPARPLAYAFSGVLALMALRLVWKAIALAG